MRQETNNEIDLLLRRLGRQAGNGGSDPDAKHLDADELNSYAENALPAAARESYTEHLAQCSGCRNLIVQLSSAAGVVVAPEQSVVSAPSGLRKFLATLFSPLVLRYAIPALGLAVIAVIGLTVFRTNLEYATDVAQRSNAPVGVIEPAPPPSQGSGDNDIEISKSDPAKAPEAGRINLSKESMPAPTALDKISAPVSAGVGNAAPAPKPEPQQEAEKTPAASPTPAAATEVAERRVDLHTQKQELDRRVAATAEAQRERAYTQARDEKRPAKEAPPAAAPASGAETKGELSTLRPGVALRRQEKDSQDDAEVRSVSGRRFRKQRGIWVDTAYDSSSATVNLTRGSEQYRALVADEPEIKHIADQLGGEVIVVWKGRAYRIR